MLKSRRSEVAPFVVMDVVQAASDLEHQGTEVLHLEIGQPGSPAPEQVLDAARDKLTNDQLGYTVALGLPKLREAIARHYRERFDVVVDPGRIIVTPGSSGAFMLSFVGLFDQGARVAVPAPSYPCYRNILKSLDLIPIDVEISASNDYLLMPEDLEKLDVEVEGVIVSSPGNPTGSMYSPEQLKALVDYCNAKGIKLISDEIYHGITFGKPCISALSYSDELLVINSFSKYFAMTGWRIGWMVVPQDLIRPIERLMQNMFISTTTLSQLAAIEAFNCYELLDKQVHDYQANRDLLLERLKAAGIDKIASPDGAFYLYADISHLTDDSVAFCQRMLEQTGVAATPGVDFDPERGHQAIRFSYARDFDTIDKASNKLKDWLQRL